MRTWWASVSVLALCVSPALAQARDRDRGRDRGDDGGRATAESRHPRPSRGWNREPARPDSGRRDGGWRPAFPGRSDRSDRPDNRPNDRSRGSWTPGDFSNRGSRYSERGREPDRGWNSRDDRQRFDSRERWDRDRRDDRWRFDSRERWNRDRRDDRWRGSYRDAPRRGWLSFRARPLRYPSGYRYGYFHRHGYYFPRYYFDYDAYPTHASLRILVDPPETEVYVDGYYAGVVDDFDGLFQRLRLAPGSHEVTLRLDGFRTWSAEIFAAPDSTVNLHHEMVPGPSGEIDESSAYEEPDPDQ